MIHRKWYFLFAFLLSVLLPSTSVFAHSYSLPRPEGFSQTGTLTREVTFSELGYSKDDMYKGVLVARDYAFQWPDAWEVKPGNLLKLVFSHSPILHPKSSMVVDWNGIRLASVLLTETNTDRAVLEVPIPEELIETGFNRLHIEFFMGLEEDFCKDEDNPGLWATVHNSSSITLAYSPKTPAIGLELYPLPFVDNSPLIENTVTFILPENPTAAELNSAAIVSAGLGKLATWHMVNIQAGLPEGQVQAGNLIVIGTPGRNRWINGTNIPFLKNNNGNYVFSDSGGNPLPAEAGILFEDISPADPVNVALYVTGASDAAMLLAARTLASTTTLSRLSGPQGIIFTVPDPVVSDLAKKRSFTLQDLGYPDMQARGTREQNITYTLTLEEAWQNESEVLLDLHFGHSVALNSRRSSVTIEVNGTAAGSIVLNQNNADNAHALFRLPSRLFSMGSNTITVSANLRLEDDVEQDWDCLANHSIESWLVVYADSLITLPGEPAIGLTTLANYPSAFIGNSSLSDMAFILPTNISVQLATAVMRISEGLGNVSAGDNYFPRVFPADEVDAAATTKKYLYLIGRPSENTAIAKLNDRLPMPFLAGTDAPQNIEGISQVLSGPVSVGYIQAYPGNQGAPNLVITGNNDEGILWAADLLQSPSRYARLTGDLAILDGPTSLTSTTVKYKSSEGLSLTEEVDVPSPGMTVVGSALRPTIWMLYSAAGVFVLALVLLIIYALVELQHRAKERSRYGSHSA